MAQDSKNIFLYNDKELWKINIGDNFDLCTFKNGSQLLAQFPFHLRKKAGLQFIIMPPYTPYIDIEHFEQVETASNYAEIKYNKKILEGLIENLPEASYINIRFKPGIKNLLPFHWKEFSIHTRYTYLIDTKPFENEQQIFDNFHPTIKKDIEKAEEKFVVEKTNEVDDLYACLQDSFGDNKKAVPATKQQLAQLVEYLTENNKGIQYLAKDNRGEVLSSIIFAFDKEFVHYYLGGSKRKAKKSGISSLLLWKGIQLANEKGLTFNFEGSMIPGIEKFFRKFNGELTPYYEVKKFNSAILKAWNSFSNKL